MPKRKVFSEHELECAGLLYMEQRNSCLDIAKKFGVSKNTIRNLLLENGMNLCNRNRNISLKAQARIYTGGWKLSQERKDGIAVSKLGNKYCVGRIVSDETKKLMSEKRKNFISENPNWNENILLGIKANKLSDNQRITNARIRSRCKNMLRRLISLGIYTKDGKTNSVLGYTLSEFKSHIESNFTPEMSWEDRNSFHIDHIIPIAVLISKGIYDPKIINALANLQALTPFQNQSKSDSYDMQNFETDLLKIASGNRGECWRYVKGQAPKRD